MACILFNPIVRGYECKSIEIVKVVCKKMKIDFIFKKNVIINHLR